MIIFVIVVCIEVLMSGGSITEEVLEVCVFLLIVFEVERTVIKRSVEVFLGSLMPFLFGLVKLGISHFSKLAIHSFNQSFGNAKRLCLEYS